MADEDVSKFVCVLKSVSIILTQLKKNLTKPEKKETNDFFDDDDDVVFEGDHEEEAKKEEPSKVFQHPLIKFAAEKIPQLI
jgi:hypothetical protein